ncbi:MAG TPA: amino acid adenylation domain-containing protein [Coleofasciculaceae cyanobacterium]|jgi:amino acid adenylation domain-containing protein
MSISIKTGSHPNTSIAKYEAFWATRLADLQPLTIPFAKQTLTQKRQFVEVVLPVPERLINSLEKSFLAIKQADILFTVLISYLARISGTVCFDIGFTDLELKQNIEPDGSLAAYIPCKIEIDLEQDLKEVVEVVQRQIEFAKQHQSYALDIVTRYPVLDSVPGIYDGQLLPVIVARVSNLEDLAGDRAAAILESDLTLIIPDHGQAFCWRYNSEVFDSNSIARMCDQFETLLQSIVANPEQSLAYQSLLPAAESHKILWEWNEPEVDFSQDKCLHQLFEAQVMRSPNAVAVVFEDRQLTYRELNNRANQLAHHLHSLGVGPEVLVGICVERSLDTVIGLMGILKAGGAYVPLDPAYPQDRIAYSIADSQIAVLLTNEQHLANLPQTQARVVCLNRDWHIISSNSVENLSNQTEPSNLAYVIYTSGTTGKPKGVLIEHHNVCRLFTATQSWYNFSCTDVWTMFHSYAFDFSVWEFWGALLYGGRLVIVPYLVSRSPDSFYQLLLDEKVTVLNQTPSAFSQLIQIDERSNLNSRLNLRLVIFGGEALEIHSLKPWFERHGDRHAQLVNMYGITETTVHVTYRPLTMADTNQQSSVIGCPIRDLKIYLLDKYLQLVPIGTIGEMYVGGSGLARGYLNRPELTQERFISSPFDSSQKLYKTGDLARYSSDGEIEYLGRIDNQVKIRGFRIELGEIEAVLAQHPEILQSVVIVREDTPGDKRLVAYVVGKSGLNLTVENLRKVLKQKLPDYMIPASFVQLEKFPLTINGKVDRRALPVPQQLLQNSAEYIVPRNESEKRLVKIWQDVLGKDKISVTADFFDLGGHSLLAVSLLTQIETTFDTNISLGTFLSSPTIEGIANVLSQKSSTSSSLLFKIRATGSKPPLFLINAVGTGMLAYKLLTKYLDPEQPVYGVRAMGMDDDRVPHNRIGEMAEAYIKEIRAVQPEGPYFLAGLCTGGTVAFEMAQRLHSQGVEIAFLGLLDSTARPILTKTKSDLPAQEVDRSPPSTIYERYIKHNFLLRGLNNLVGVVTNPRLKLQDKLAFTADMVEQLYQKIKDKLEVFTYKNNQKTKRLPYSVRRSRVYEAGIDALLNHTPSVYQGGKVILFRAPDNPEHIFHDYQLGWNEFVANEIEVHEVLGDQTTMLFEPNIKILAAQINSCLNEIYQNS